MICVRGTGGGPRLSVTSSIIIIITSYIAAHNALLVHIQAVATIIMHIQAVATIINHSQEVATIITHSPAVTTIITHNQAVATIIMCDASHTASSHCHHAQPIS